MTGRHPVAVSLLATGAALALGVGVGAGPIAQESVAGSTAERAQLREEVERLQDRVARLAAQSATDQRALEALAEPLVGDRLADRTVTVLATPAAAGADVRRTKAALTGAGATVVTTVHLTGTYVDPARAQSPLEDLALRLVPPGVEFADGADAIGRVGTVLARALVRKPGDGAGPEPEPSRRPDQDAAEVIAGLDELGALRLAGKPGELAELAVVVTGPEEPAAEPALSGLVTALDTGSRGVVVLGPGSAATGLLRWVRDAKDPALAGASTVDGAGTPASRVAVVLAVAEQAAGGRGSYGSGRGADAVVPVLDLRAPRVASGPAPTG